MYRPIVVRSLVTSLLVAGALACAPAAALAQDAGGDQYSDPITTTPHPSMHHTTTATGTPSASPARTSTATTGTARAKTLPRTGFPVSLLVLIGALSIGSGMAVRRAAWRF